MNTKLTLSLSKEIIDKAKIYAKKNNVSLSFLIENYLNRIISEYPFEQPKKGSIVDELSGIISLESGMEHKDIYGDHLNEKHR